MPLQEDRSSTRAPKRRTAACGEDLGKSPEGKSKRKRRNKKRNGKTKTKIRSRTQSIY